MSSARPRAGDAPSIVPAPAAPATPRRRARLDEAPKPPWAPFPLVELAILVGLILFVMGFVTGGDQARVLLLTGLALITLATLELSVREHFAGYRSHSSLLAGALAVGTLAPLAVLTGLPRLLVLAIAVLVFALAFWLLRDTFRRRTGGMGFRA